jgi:hypothetical protein
MRTAGNGCRSVKPLPGAKHHLIGEQGGERKAVQVVFDAEEKRGKRGKAPNVCFRW